MFSAGYTLAEPKPVASVSSPDSKQRIVVERDAESGRLTWSAAYAAHGAVTGGALGLVFEDGEVLGDDEAVAAVETSNSDTTWMPMFGENRRVRDHYNQADIRLKPGGDSGRVLVLRLRAYDAGVAFRYVVESDRASTVERERTTIKFSGDAMVWGTANTEDRIKGQPLDSVNGKRLSPMLIELNPALFVAVGEAALDDQPVMGFEIKSGGLVRVRHPSKASYEVGFKTSWRFVRMAGSATGLLEGNEMMLNLNPPAEDRDWSWVRPGKMLRDWTLSTKGGMACVDWAAEHNFQYILYDAGWYGHEHSKKSNATTVTPDPKRSQGPLDLRKVIDYGKTKNIGVFVYVNRNALEQQLDEVLSVLQEWGVAGIKFGFVHTGPQKWTRWLHESIQKCADHKLMVNVHDTYRVTGNQRTYPHLLTVEGVGGDEKRPPTEHTIATVFTRCLVGAADFTNCYFSERIPGMGGHAAQLAKTVCVYSPLQVLFWYDRPPVDNESIEGVAADERIILDVPELTFFERVPSVWDETRWLAGHPNTHVVAARRSNELWFVGALNSIEARDIEVDLSFLPEGKRYKLELFYDDPGLDTPTHVGIDTREVGGGDTIKVHMEPRKGFAAVMTPVL